MLGPGWAMRTEHLDAQTPVEHRSNRSRLQLRLCEFHLREASLAAHGMSRGGLCGDTLSHYHFGVSDSEEPTPAPKVKVKVWSWAVESVRGSGWEWRRDGRDGLGKPELRAARRREPGA